MCSFRRCLRCALISASLMLAVGGSAHDQSLATLLRQMDAQSRNLRSARARIVVTREQTEGYMRYLRRYAQIAPDAQVVPRTEGEWAYKEGKRWFRGTHLVGGSTHEIESIYDGRRSFKMQLSGQGRDRYMRATVYRVEYSAAQGPLDYGWFLNGKPASEVLRQGGFRVVGREESPEHGPLVRVVGREWPSHPAPTTMWIAERKGCLPVRVERCIAEGQEPYEILETTRVEKVGPVWLPVTARGETRVPGGKTVNMVVATDVRVNDVPDSLFTPKWTHKGEVWDSGIPLQIETSSGRLSLDPRMPRAVGWSDRQALIRLVVAVAVFASLAFIVIASVHRLRKTVRLTTR